MKAVHFENQDELLWFLRSQTLNSDSLSKSIEAGREEEALYVKITTGSGLKASELTKKGLKTVTAPGYLEWNKCYWPELVFPEKEKNGSGVLHYFVSLTKWVGINGAGSGDSTSWL